MANTVFVYDDTLATVTDSAIEFIETDDAHVTLATAMNAAMTPGVLKPEYGATLTPNPSPVIIWVDDTKAKPTYAAVTLGKLHGDQPNLLRAILYPLPKVPPSPPSSLPAITIMDAERLIEDAVQAERWTPREGNGVRTLIGTVAKAAAIPEPSEEFARRRNRWIGTLRQLGILLTYRLIYVP